MPVQELSDCRGWQQSLACTCPVMDLRIGADRACNVSEYHAFRVNHLQEAEWIGNFVQQTQQPNSAEQAITRAGLFPSLGLQGWLIVLTSARQPPAYGKGNKEPDYRIAGSPVVQCPISTGWIQVA